MKVTYYEKYLLSLQEEFTLEDIKKLFDVGMPRAREIRNKALDFCIVSDISVEGRKIPSRAVFEVMNVNVEFFYNKMEMEYRALKLKRELSK